MDKIMNTSKGTGKVILALLGCLLMPVLIWVGLGTALYQKNQKLVPKIAPEIAEIRTEAN
jgi:hypothetical protein